MTVDETFRWENPVSRGLSPPTKREGSICIVCLEECSGMEREKLCIVGGECRFTAHEICLERWFQINLACPVCREVVDTNTISDDLDIVEDGIDANDIDTYYRSQNGNIMKGACIAGLIIGLIIVIYSFSI